MSTEVTIPGSERDAQRSRARQIGFYVTGGLFLLMCLAFFALLPDPPLLLLIVTGWFQPEALGIHQLHETLASTLFWSIIVGMLFTMARPVKTISALRQTLGILLTVVLLLVASGNLMESAVMMTVLLVLAGITAALHPARKRLLQLRGGIQPWLLILTIVATIPVLIYALGQLRIQIGAGAADEHAQFGHWALMSGYTFAIVISAFFASLGSSGWRVSTWTAGIMAGLFGLAPIVLPGQASSVSVAWGFQAIGWGLVFVVAAELLHAREAAELAA